MEVDAAEEEVQETEKELTAYEQLYKKLQQKRKAADKVTNQDSKKARVKITKKKQVNEDMDMDPDQNKNVTAQFIEGENLIDMGVTVSEQMKEFPTPSEEEDSGSEEEEKSFELCNNNAMATVNIPRPLPTSSQGSQSLRMGRVCNELPNRCEPSPDQDNGKDKELTFTLSMMQKFMLKKGLINETMDMEEIEKFLNEPEEKADNQANKQLDQDNPVKNKRTEKTPQKPSKTGRTVIVEHDNRIPCVNTSETTVYKRAVPTVVPDMNLQIQQFISDVRNNANKEGSMRKLSNSSDETMDTSDELEPALIMPNNFIAGETTPGKNKRAEDEPVPGTSASKLTADEQAEEIIRESERAKAKLYEVPGMGLFTNKINIGNDIIQMDLDYQMIDSHLDEGLKCKIQCFEFVDFSKLIVKNRSSSDDQRLELINRNGQTYLSPVSEHEFLQINSYIHWEQAFRVYSNVLMARFPQKAQELLQYNHTIHTASVSYSWENVYAYDKEFCHHISRHPTRSWAVILQQAWTMILKDRIKGDHWNQKGGKGKKPEICKRFNKGRCSYGLSCRYEH